MRCAIIENNIVVNLIVADDPALFGAIPSETASIGDIWDGETFMPPTPPAPLSVARAQGVLSRAAKCLIGLMVVNAQ